MINYTRQGDEVYKYALRNLNLRSSKSTSSNIITVIPAGSKIQILDDAEDWYDVMYNGQKGYLYNSGLSTTKYTWTDVFLRSSPNSESKSLALVPDKSRIQVLSSNGDWDNVIYNDQEGYIFNYFLSDDANPPAGYDFEYFNTDMSRFVNDNNIKSPTNYLITTSLENRLTYIFQKSSNNHKWDLLYTWSCTIGKPQTPTIKGTFYVSGRKPFFGTDTYRVKYATRIRGSYYYHSILFNAQGTEVINDTLGAALSHGCIRLALDNAHWIYDHILDTTTIIIN